MYQSTTRTTFALKSKGSFIQIPNYGFMIPKVMTCWTEDYGEWLGGYKKSTGEVFTMMCIIFLGFDQLQKRSNDHQGAEYPQ